MTRDLSLKQFRAACERYGFKPQCMGYYDVGHDTWVNVLNAGDRRRNRLSYLMREADKASARYYDKHPEKACV